MQIKILLLLKRIFLRQFYSCSYICSGINFYPNNIIKTCCFTSSDDVNLCKINNDGTINYNELNKNRKNLFNRLKKGDIPECCKNCFALQKSSWIFSNAIKSIVLNYFMFCNLRCVHCGYLKKVRFKVDDTKDEFVFNIIKSLENKKLLTKDYIVDIGGGEPSINEKLDKIIDYLIRRGHKVHINSNIAKFKENYIYGINNNLIFLTLTPDAGSKEVYKKIKGVDYFDEMKENLKEYMKRASDKIEVKFILEKGNISDIENMIRLCLDCNVKKVVCSIDLNIKKEEYDFYKPYLTLFHNLCYKNGLNLKYSGLVPKEMLR